MNEEQNSTESEVGKATQHLRSIAEAKLELFKLELLEKLSEALSVFAVIAFLSLLLSGFFILLGIALGTWMGNLLDNEALGYLSGAGILFLLGLVIWLLRKPLIINPVLEMMYKKILEKDENKNSK